MTGFGHSLSPSINIKPSLARRLNRSRILDLLRQHSPIAPSEISRRTQMSMPTVMRLLDELANEGLVRRLDSHEESGGRPRSLFAFEGSAHAVIGLDLGGTKMYGTIADLNGNIQTEMYFPSSPFHSEENIEIVFRLIEKLLAVPLREGQRLIGIGVGAPGVTLPNEGVVTWAPALGWRDVPLRDLLYNRFGLPVQVENDVNLAALGEYGFGSAKGASSLVCIAVGTGVGSGIVLDRKIYHGFHQSAGEVGYLPPDRSALGKRYEQFGALESLASGTGVQECAIKMIAERGLPYNPKEITAEKVFDAARRGESWAQEVIAEMVDYLALAVASVSIILDPEVIILGGGVAKSADMLIEPILRRLEGVVPVPVRLEATILGYRAAVMGAIMLVLDTITDYVALKTL